MIDAFYTQELKCFLVNGIMTIQKISRNTDMHEYVRKIGKYVNAQCECIREDFVPKYQNQLENFTLNYSIKRISYLVHPKAWNIIQCDNM